LIDVRVQIITLIDYLMLSHGLHSPNHMDGMAALDGHWLVPPAVTVYSVAEPPRQPGRTSGATWSFEQTQTRLTAYALIGITWHRRLR